MTGNVTGNLNGNVTGNLTGNVTGTVSSANSWSSPRNIILSGDVTGNVFIDGTQNVTINTSIQPNSVTLGIDTTGDYLANLVSGTGITITDNSGEGMTPVISVTPNVYDSYGAATTAEQNAAAYADSVSGAAYSNSISYINSRTINDLSDVSIANVAGGDFLRYNGSSWINDPVNLATDTIGSYVESLVAGTGITLTNNSGEGSTPTIAVTADTYDAFGAAAAAVNTAASALSNHESNTTNIHGIADTSILVTTTGTQTLTNKTITSPSGLVKGDVGLGNADNTSDANKPISTATQTALDLKATLNANVSFNIVTADLVGTVTGQVTDISNHSYVDEITSGDDNIIITPGIGLGPFSVEVATSPVPEFTAVSTTSLYVDGIEIDTTGAVFGQVLKFNGIKFIPDEDTAEEGSGTLSKYSATIGDGANTTFTVTHSLGTRDVVVEVYETGYYETVYAAVRRATLNSIEVTFATPPDSSSRRVVVTG